LTALTAAGSELGAPILVSDPRHDPDLAPNKAVPDLSTLGYLVRGCRLTRVYDPIAHGPVR